MYTEAVKYRFFLTVLQRKAIALALACCTKKVELIIISGWLYTLQTFDGFERSFLSPYFLQQMRAYLSQHCVLSRIYA